MRDGSATGVTLRRLETSASARIIQTEWRKVLIPDHKSVIGRIVTVFTEKPWTLLKRRRIRSSVYKCRS